MNRRPEPATRRSSDVPTTPDLWHHYGRARAGRDPAVPRAFRWDWAQAGGPGAEVLGDFGGRVVGELGAGAGRHAAHLVAYHAPAEVAAVDASPAQHALALGLYGHLAPRLRCVHAGAVEHLRVRAGAYDVLYSVFGAVDFTEPRTLLPAACAALRPGGRLVFSTLAHHVGGARARPEVTATEIPARTPDGAAMSMPRWVLTASVWANALERAGFADVRTDVLPAAGDREHAAGTLLVTAFRPAA
ncbi:SAM-dependent methyltransferase [Streptomyces albidoflavus]|uniref:class I SAM-dependent methyltransferase n=1 Tax=Streptomyces albidoflavus TaxID=1886 RepID=UPI000BADE091|nr:class I SAM-dependent methyltransferase [Streptomyces albidoflavus]MBF4132902.1 class I SAM-dependent methyltransferase [Streptomyces albidoflavus]PAX88170.1 SAM-dependent methyltransferase [Streptomyces albidoflavus]PAX89308.1 SAM-dependent methyltransferase [Streptomyces albidoflavus]PBO19562.1 SAM-dependent methyltransferase [Streptomyces albidoflavus]PBO23504.1 SAM-dependent methyltransferase [Streptomyces albidoflavus]